MNDNDVVGTSRWRAQRSLSFALRTGILLGPLIAAAGTAIVVSSWLPPAPTRAWLVMRTLAVVASTTVALLVVDRLARRLLPLATLMRLSLVFPDQAPSRFSLAVAAGNRRKMRRLVEHARVYGFNDDIGRAATEVLQLATALSNHDRRTRGHSERVSVYADLIGEEMGLTVLERQKLQWAALLHDVGKVAVPSEILNKPGKLTTDEWDVMVEHASVGEAMVASLRPFLGEWIEGVGGHHEKWDGTGYPRGLAGANIPRSAAIISVADSFEVMTAARSYKKALSLAEARRELTRCAGTHFAPDVVRSFLTLSIGRLRLAMGPLAALAHVPLLANLASVPTAVTTSVGSAVTNATALATSITTVAAMSTALVTSGVVEPGLNAANASTDGITIEALRANPPTTLPLADGTISNPTVRTSAGSSGAPSRQPTGSIGGATVTTTTTTNPTVAAPGSSPNTPVTTTTTIAGSAPVTTTTAPGEVPVATTTTTIGAAPGHVEPTTTTIPAPKKAPTTTNASIAPKTVEPVIAINPYLVCVEKRSKGYRAFFGYTNNGAETRIPVGETNHFDPAPYDRGQTTTFKAGTVQKAFTVDWDGSLTAWRVNGNAAYASSLSTPCK